MALQFKVNLWTFVLLGFLAQASNGCFEVGYSTLQQAIISKLSAALHNLKGISLPGFVLPTSPSLTPNVKDIASIATVSERESGNKWLMGSSWYITISSTGLTDLKFELEVSGEMDLALENGSPILFYVPKKWSIFLIVDKSETGTLTSRSLPTAYTDNCQLLLKATIQQAWQSAIGAMNLQFQRVTNPVSFLGSTWRYQVREIQYLADSLVFYEDAVLETADAVQRFNFYSAPVTTSALEAGWSYAIRISEGFVTSIINTVKISYERTLTAAEFEAYKIFPKVSGPKRIQVKQNALPVYRTTSAESILTLELRVSTNDEPGNLLFEIDFNVKLCVGVSRRKRSLWLSFGCLKIKTRTAFVDSKCDCGNDPIPYVKSLTTSSITEAISKMQSSFENPLPDPIPFDFLTSESTCSNVKGVTICGA